MNTPHLNRARFDFVSVRLAVVCARVGNLTEAASECHLVLPAASRRLRDLERALGAPLFERHPRGLKPTALGRAFTKRGMAILHELDNLRVERADASHGIVRHLQVFASTAAITQFLPALLAEYGDLHPEVQVEMEEQVSQQVVAAVREGRADLGVFARGRDHRTGRLCRDARAWRHDGPCPRRRAHSPRLSWPRWVAAPSSCSVRPGHRRHSCGRFFAATWAVQASASRVRGVLAHRCGPTRWR